MSANARVSAEDLERFRKAVAENPTSAAAHLNLGTAFLKLELLDHAEAEFRSALKIDPDYPEALVNLGGVLLQRWDFQGCLEANRRAGQRKPELTLAHYNEGLAHLYLGNAAEVVRCFTRVIEAEPGNGGGHYHLAAGLLALGDVRESRAHLDASVAAGHSPQPDFLKALQRAEAGPVPTMEIDGSGEQSSTTTKED